MELALDGPAGPVAISWSPAPDDDGRTCSRSAAPVVAGELLVAEPGDTDPAILEIADVICGTPGRGRGRAAAWLAHVLDRYPGCAVAAIADGPGWCLVGMRAFPALPVTVHITADCAARVVPVLCASFIYGWLAAGRPVTALAPARLGVSARRAGTRDQIRPAPLPAAYEFALYELASPRPGAASPARSSSRSWVVSASGAPTAE